MDALPVVWQYATIGVGVFLLVLVVLWLYNRREKRRKHAIELANLMQEWGLKWFAETYQMYAVGDYSGLFHKVREIVSAMRSDEAMVSKLHDVTTKVATYYADNEPDKAAKLMAILTKAQPPAPPPAPAKPAA